MLINIIEGDLDSIISTAGAEWDKCLKFFEKDLLTMRTGRASISLVEHIKVDAYGQMTSLRELATITTPDARSIFIQPWDKSLINSIQKGILTSDLGITPNVDGTMVRLQLPMMSQERREEMTKTLHKKTEATRVQMRNLRRDVVTAIKDSEKGKKISEDFSERAQQAIQKAMDQWIAKAEAVALKKEGELKTV